MTQKHADSKKGTHAYTHARTHTRLCSTIVGQEALPSAKQLDYCTQTLPVGAEVGQTQRGQQWTSDLWPACAPPHPPSESQAPADQ